MVTLTRALPYEMSNLDNCIDPVVTICGQSVETLLWGKNFANCDRSTTATQSSANLRELRELCDAVFQNFHRSKQRERKGFCDVTPMSHHPLVTQTLGPSTNV